MPPEWMPHSRCWMAYPNAHMGWAENLSALRRTIATLAQAIRRFEPVSVIVSAVDEQAARNDLGADIDLVVMDVDDLWMRDTGPSFLVKAGGGVSGAVWGFNAWGEKFPGHVADRNLAQRLLARLNLAVYPAPIITEGGESRGGRYFPALAGCDAGDLAAGVAYRDSHGRPYRRLCLLHATWPGAGGTARQ
jgi:agmatine deiminase